MQCGSADCGIYAITFSTTLANGEKPGRYCFDLTQMRKHLIHCLESQCLSFFPITQKRRKGGKVKWSTAFHVYCSYRMPQQPGSTMAECYNCKDWFHIGTCVTVPAEALGSAAKWFYNQCV